MIGICIIYNIYYTQVMRFRNTKCKALNAVIIFFDTHQANLPSTIIIMNWISLTPSETSVQLNYNPVRYAVLIGMSVIIDTFKYS